MTNRPLKSRVARAAKLYREAEALLMEELKARVMRVLRGKNRAHSFCMAMGSWSFTGKNGEELMNWVGAEPRYMRSVETLLSEWRDFKLTGNPLRIDSPDGKFYTDW